jgi:hypothetical protein
MKRHIGVSKVMFSRFRFWLDMSRKREMEFDSAYSKCIDGYWRCSFQRWGFNSGGLNDER